MYWDEAMTNTFNLKTLSKLILYVMNLKAYNTNYYQDGEKKKAKSFFTEHETVTQFKKLMESVGDKKGMITKIEVFYSDKKDM